MENLEGILKEFRGQGYPGWDMEAARHKGDYVKLEELLQEQLSFSLAVRGTFDLDPQTQVVHLLRRALELVKKEG